MKKLYYLLLVLGLVAIVAFSQPKQQQSGPDVGKQTGTDIGKQAPSFTLQGLDQKTYQLSGPRDKPLVINFWASWCGPCQAEAPALRDIYLKMNKEIDFYAINATKDDDAQDAKKFVEYFKLPFPVPMDVKGEVTKSYQITAFPTTFLIDRNGVVRRQIVGMIEPDMFEKMLQAFITIK